MMDVDYRFHLADTGTVDACNDAVVCPFGGETGALNHFVRRRDALAVRAWRADPRARLPLSAEVSVQRLIQDCVFSNTSDMELSRVGYPYVQTDSLSELLFDLEEADPYPTAFRDSNYVWLNVLEELTFEVEPHRPSSQRVKETVATFFPRAFEAWRPELARLDILESAELLDGPLFEQARSQRWQ